MIKKNDRGNDVKKLQEDLVRLGYPLPKSTSKDGGLDGICGAELLEQAAQFACERRLHGLPGNDGKYEAGVVANSAILAGLQVGQIHEKIIERASKDVPRLRFLDVSEYQGDASKVDWSLAAPMGFTGLYLRATIGKAGIDKQVRNHVRALSKLANAGTPIPRIGFYHFWIPTTDPISQILHFATTVQELLKDSPFPPDTLFLLPALDLEGDTKPFNAQEFTRRIDLSLTTILSQFPTAPGSFFNTMIYSSARMTTFWGFTSGQSSNWWLARYTVPAPLDAPPLPSQTQSFSLHQTGYGPLAPLFSNVDRSLARFGLSLNEISYLPA